MHGDLTSEETGDIVLGCPEESVPYLLPMTAGGRLPGWHVTACACAGLLAPLLAHSAVIIPAGGRFSAKTFWQDACQYQATFYTAVPTMHQVLGNPVAATASVSKLWRTAASLTATS